LKIKKKILPLTQKFNSKTRS